MKKIYTLLLLFTITLFYSIPTQAFDIPLNYGVSDNDQKFVQTKNLFDGEWESGTLNFITGVEETSATLFRTDFIIIEPNTTYTLKRFVAIQTNGIREYDINENYLGFIPGMNGTDLETTFTTRSNGAYIRIVDNLDASNGDWQLELGSTATSYAPYGFLSLNDIFVDGNLLDNYDFTNGTTSWLNSNATFTVSNNTATFTATSTTGNINQAPGTTLAGHNIYVAGFIKSDSNAVRLDNGDQAIKYHSGSNNYEILSVRFVAPANAGFQFRVIDLRGSGFTPIYVKNAYYINLQNLYIDHLTINEIDGLFYDFVYNNIYNQGFTDGELSSEAYANGFTAGYEVGYGDGYTDAVEEDNAYALGFAKGLLEGTDMETGSSLLILIVAAIGFIMMIFGFATKRRIFNLLSVGAFIVLGGLLAEFVGFIIITVGLVFVNVYYTFFGDI
jgi:hypothetical protein